MASSRRVSSTITLNQPPTSATALISTLHLDILVTHILSRLDGWALTVLSSTNTNLRGQIIAEQTLWRDTCLQLWPSIQQHPRLQQIISSSFLNGYYGFFSDAFPILTGNMINPHCHDNNSSLISFPQELISAVDIRYNNNLIFSRVQEESIMKQHTGTAAAATSHVHLSPFQIVVLNQKESSFPLPIKSTTDHGTILRELEEKLELSWIIIDPIKNRSALNVSSLGPVSVKRQWISGKIDLKYSTVLTYGSKSSAWVSLEVGITCNDGEGKGQIHVEEVWMQVEDVQGNRLNVKESVGVLTSLMKCGERKRREENDYLWRYRQYMERKREWREREKRIIRRKKILHVGYCFGILSALFFVFQHSSVATGSISKWLWFEVNLIWT